MTDKVAKIEHKCFDCKGPIAEGETYELIMDGLALPVHVICPVVIEPESIDTFVPPFYRAVKFVLDAFDVKV